MENVFLDSSVFLDYFLGGPKKEKSRNFIYNIVYKKIKGIINSICILEVKYHIVREKGHDKAEDAIFFIKNIENLEIVYITDVIAERAADIRIKYYSKDKPMSFADALHIATAIEKNCSKIITADSDFSGIAEMKAEIY